MIALDIVNEKQLQAMANFVETKLANNLEEEHNVSVICFAFIFFNRKICYFLQSTEVIFDAILPEWALAVFCKKFNLTRIEAVERLKFQSQALIEIGESDI